MLTCSLGGNIDIELNWSYWIGIKCEKMLLWLKVMWS